MRGQGSGDVGKGHQRPTEDLLDIFESAAASHEMQQEKEARQGD